MLLSVADSRLSYEMILWEVVLHYGCDPDKNNKGAVTLHKWLFLARIFNNKMLLFSTFVWINIIWCGFVILSQNMGEGLSEKHLFIIVL